MNFSSLVFFSISYLKVNLFLNVYAFDSKMIFCDVVSILYFHKVVEIREWRSYYVNRDTLLNH